MMEHTIDSKLKSLIVNWSGGVTKEEKITHDATLRELGIDKGDQLELELRAEDVFSIEICDKDHVRIKTYGDFLNIIKKKLS
jgi:acyl carrier protein